MITPQEIREKSFEKAVFGGYDMATVDAFLEEVAADLTLLMRENNTLKGKMKVLVDKVEEYRGNEDALRMAVLSAQRMGANIEKESRDKAEAILKDARDEAGRIVEEATYESRAEKARLEEAKSVSAKFIDSMEMLCNRQLEFLQKMNELDFIRQLRESQAAGKQSAPAAPAAPAKTPAPAPTKTYVPREQPAQHPVQQSAPAAPAQEPAPEIHETVKTIEETVARAMGEPVMNLRPELRPTLVEDERPTRSYNAVTDLEDPMDRVSPLTLEDLGQ